MLSRRLLFRSLPQLCFRPPEYKRNIIKGMLKTYLNYGAHPCRGHWKPLLQYVFNGEMCRYYKKLLRFSSNIGQKNSPPKYWDASANKNSPPRHFFILTRKLASNRFWLKTLFHNTNSDRWEWAVERCMKLLPRMEPHDLALKYQCFHSKVCGFK